jgi:hypothetical protein
MQGTRLLDQVRGWIRSKHYSLRIEETYVHWIKRLVLFNHKRHPSALGVSEVEGFLTHLAVEGKVSASTQNQAKRGILFLARKSWSKLYHGWTVWSRQRPQNAFRWSEVRPKWTPFLDTLPAPQD